jgi:long-subunit fatty acid transport protein
MARGSQQATGARRARARRAALAFILSASLSPHACTAVQTAIPLAPEPVGSGARALGQSAFIAVADDATAASWNPAGLINLEKPEASFVGVWKTVESDPSARTAGFSYEGQSWSQGDINFMSYAQPLHIRNKDVVLSVNYHQVYDLGLETHYVDFTNDRKHEVVSKGAISAYSLAGGLSMPYSPQVTVGASFNWYTQSLLNGYARQVKDGQWIPKGDIFEKELTETLDDFRGYNFTFGVLWDVYKRQENLLTLGFVCHTPFTARVNQTTKDRFGDGYIEPWPSGRLSVDFPLSLGAGVNYRFSDRFSTAFDLQWTDWSEFGYTDAPTKPDSDALALRLGFERLWFSQPGRGSVYALRGGVFYEPRPAWSDILPVYGLSLGLGWTLKDLVSLDFAYQFRWGEGEDFTADGVSRFDYGVTEHWLIGSVVVYFK